MNTRKRTTALFAGSSILAAVLLAGCGSASGHAGHSTGASGSPSGPGTGSSTGAVRTAWRTTSHATSAQLSMTEHLEASGNDETVVSTGVTRLGGAAGRAKGSFTVRADGHRIAVRVLGRTLYEQLPPGAARAKLSGGKPWIKVDTTRLPAGAGSGSDGTAQAPDAGAQLDYLKGAGTVHRVGTATVDGTATTHYRTTVNSGALGGTAAHVSGRVPVDVWIDSHHRVRQERLTLHLTAAAGTTSSGATPGSARRTAVVTVVMRLTGFGTPVHVTAPPAARTTDVTRKLASAASPNAA
jgi:hypothetical protein